jgi:hypothetical protein
MKPSIKPIKVHGVPIDPIESERGPSNDPVDQGISQAWRLRIKLPEEIESYILYAEIV